MFTGLKTQNELTDCLIDDIVPHDHDLVKLKKLLNWEGINRVYESCYPSGRGNATKRTELVIGLLILKHLYKKPDRVLIDELHVNNAFMHFCSVSYEEMKGYNGEGKKLIDHSTLVKVRKKLGDAKVQKIERLFREELIAKKVIVGKYVYSDTTSLEKNISYPTEVSLLKRVIEHAEMVVQGVVKKKELGKSAVIKKANRIAKVYYSASKKTKELLEGATKQLLSMAKDTLERAAGKLSESGTQVTKELKKEYERVKRVGKRIVEQVEGKLRGEKVTDRIVSYYEEEARALPKGKVHKPCEFGHKVRLDMNGEGYITNWRLCRGNPSDVGMLEEVVEEHAERFGGTFQAGAMDRGYYDGEKIEELEEKFGIRLAIPHKSDRKKVLSQQKKRLYDKRSAIESRISEGKRMAGLDKSYYRGFDGDGIWMAFTVMVLNIRKMLMAMRKKPAVWRKLSLSNG